ncbi:cytochrome P450 6k1-like [Schistocerca cancellata]|uniref:cytochrome P450 6k1-like n=1 Tax=Schistocerca cancellata TaxID=274614 RepID=UPI0021183A3E|nr:cytochrome P450 6k1-like [Schistocerca cancellata]
MITESAPLGSWSTTLLAAVVLGVISFSSFFALRFRYWKNRGVPYIPPSFPFGNMRRCFLGKMSMGMNIAEIYKRMKGHRFVGIYALPRPVLVIIDPTLVHCVLVKDFHMFYDRGMNLDETMPLNRQLFCLAGNNWKRLRLKLEPAFAPSKLKMMFPAMRKYAVDLCEVLEAAAATGDIADMHELAARFTTDVIASLAFGVQANSLRNPDSEFRQWVRRIFMTSFTRMLSVVALFLSPTLFKILKLIGEKNPTSQYFVKLARYTISFRESNNVTKNDFMQLLIQLRNVGTLDDDRGRNGVEDVGVIRWKLPLEDVEATALMFLIAGFETSSATLSFTLHELAVNQDIQRRLQDETDRTWAFTFDSVVQMRYLDKVVKETLRKYPVVPVLNRKACVDYKIPDSDVTIQKGTPVMISVYGLHRDPVFFPDPERFDPERFSKKLKIHPWAYLPFGDGPRNCIGIDFALLQVKLGLVHILSKFNVDICDRTKTGLQFSAKSFILAPDGGVPLRLSKRKSRRED